ncbi:hypothetical protein FOL47_004132, partial [Perkinsus chesapeaki]
LRAWKKVTSEAVIEPVPAYPTVWDREDLLVVVRSDQMCRKQCALCIRFARKAKWTLPVGGPMFDIRALLTSPSYRPYEVVGIDYVTVEGVKVEFIMMWGTPRLVLSDRASYFRSTLWLQFLKSHNIQSWLNAAVAPWEGSFYERLHGIVRTILRPILLVPYTRRMLREFDPRNVSDVRS